MTLRRKVLGRMPIKKIRGCHMDGSTWVNLL
jgi:hypothetical protein